MVTVIIASISVLSLLCIEYLTVYSGLAIGPAVEYNSVCAYMYRVVKGSGPAAALENLNEL